MPVKIFMAGADRKLGFQALENEVSAWEQDMYKTWGVNRFHKISCHVSTCAAQSTQEELVNCTIAIFYTTG